VGGTLGHTLDTWADQLPGVLLRERLTDEQVRQPGFWIASLAGDSSEPKHLAGEPPWEVALPWPLQPQAQVPSEDRWPLLVSFHQVDTEAEASGCAYYSPDDWQCLAAVVGWAPAQKLEVSAHCNSPESHGLVAWLCAEMADRCGGLWTPAANCPEPTTQMPGCWSPSPTRLRMADSVALTSWIPPLFGPGGVTRSFA
jgi:Family of unknown function (DUF6368)